MTNEDAVEILHQLDGRIRLGMNVGWSDPQVSEAFACAMAALAPKPEEIPKPPVGYAVEVKNSITGDWVVKYVHTLGLDWCRSNQFPYSPVEPWASIKDWRYIPPLEWKGETPCFLYFRSGASCFCSKIPEPGEQIIGGEVIHVLTHEKWLEKEVAV